MKQEAGQDVRLFVVWEAVLPTDWMAPSTMVLRRIADVRARQYWDKRRLLSKAMGEKDKPSITWDQVLVYQRGAVWTDAAPPAPLDAEGPVVKVVPGFTAALRRALALPQP